jgi:adenosylcobinamide kinase / adenosylcobinamide-phosphate guanylyltransferase
VTGKIVLIGGGVRSGKSSLAVKLGHELGQKRAFIATATRSDDEMRARIRRHIEDRRGDFETIEAPLELAAALGSVDADVVVVDCVTHWLSNMLINKLGLETMLERVDQVVNVLERRRCHVVLVTNEVGMSIHPPTELGRVFVELCGFAHQRLARAADEVHLAVLGTHLRIKPAPGAITQAKA